MRKQVSILLCLLVLMTTLTGCLGQKQQTQEEDSSTLGSTDQSLYQGLIRGKDDDTPSSDEELAIETQETDTAREQEELKEYYKELDEQREDDLAELNELLGGGEVTLEDCEKFEDAEIKDVCVMSVEMIGEN